MSGEKPYFELHIRPMFRLIDRDHMLWFGDLHDYDFVKDNANEILDHLKSDMPMVSTGGLWPSGWIDVFEAWKNSLCPRLQIAVGTYKAVLLQSGAVQLNVGVSANSDDAAWLDRIPAAVGVYDYVLYLRPGNGGGSNSIAIQENYAPPGPTSIFITDITGRKQIPITKSP